MPLRGWATKPSAKMSATPFRDLLLCTKKAFCFRRVAGLAIAIGAGWSGSAEAAAPANDSFANAQTIALGTTYQATTLNATREVGDPEPDAHNRSVWFSFTPTVSQVVSLSGTTTDDPLYGYLVHGDSLLSLRLLGEQVFTSRPLAFYAVAGTTYRLCVDDYVPGYINYQGYPFSLGLAGGAALPVNTQFITPLSNDNFNQALTLPSASASVVMNSTEATFEPFEQDMLNRFSPRPRYSTSGSGGVWAAWTAPGTGQATLTAQTPTNSKVVVVLAQGDSIPNLTLLQGNYNQLAFACNQGETYRFYFLSQDDGQILAKLDSTTLPPQPPTPHIDTYVGLVGEDTYLSFTLSLGGRFSGRLFKDGTIYGVRGKLDETGSFTGTAGKPATVYSVQASGGATASTADDTISLTIGGVTVLARPRFYARTTIPPTVGILTALLKPGEVSSTVPQGTGYGTARVKTGGTISLSGKTADGKSYGAAGVLTVGSSGDPQFVIFNRTLYGGKGVLAGALTFNPVSDSDFTGVLAWKKPEQKSGAYYRNAFATHLDVVGAVFKARPGGTSLLPLAAGADNAALKITGGGLGTAIMETATVTSANKVLVTGSNPAKVKVSLSAKNGLVSGSFVHPVTNKAVTFVGAIFQNAQKPGAAGYFRGPVQAGVGEVGNFVLSAP